MKGIALALLSFALLVGLSVVLLRRYRGRKHYRVLLAAFATASAAYVGAHVATPADLGVFAERWLEPNRAVDIANGAVLLALLFHSYWDTLYTAVLTGFSANLLVVLDREGGLGIDEVVRIYGADGADDHLVARRVRGLVEDGYLAATRPQDGSVRLTPKGRAMACLVKILKRLLTGRVEGG